MIGSAALRTSLAPGGALAGPWVQNELWRRARAVPSLDLRFADDKSLVNAKTGQNLVTFTRASSATYVDSDGLIKTASTDIPRFNHNPTTGESLGLLVEEQRTNLLLQSEAFATTWTATRSSITSNSVAAPDGTTTADSLIEDTTASQTHLVSQSVSITNGTSYTFSCFAKANTRPSIRLTLGSAGFTTNLSATFNLQGGNLIVASANATATITPYPNGWYRCSISATATASTSTSFQLLIGDSATTSNVTYTGDGTSGIYIWGAQLEAGAFPTSYIPTTTAAVTRSADVASISGAAFSSWYNQAAGTLFVEGATAGLVATTGYVAINAASSTNRIDIRQSRSNPTVTGSSISASWSQISAAPVLVANTFYKQALAISGSNHGNSIGGGLDVSSSAIGDIAATQLILGMRDGQTAPTGGSSSLFKRLTFFPQRLSNSTLQELTR
jgi:hypothetical protein